MSKYRAGDIHHLGELQQLEKLLHTSFDLEHLYNELMDFIEKNFKEQFRDHRIPTTEELQSIDDFVRKFVMKRLTTAEQMIVRAFVVGKLISDRETARTAFLPKIDINKLPVKVKNAASEYKLTIAETRALEWSSTSVGLRLTTATADTVGRVQNLVFENIKKQGSTRDLRRQLGEEFFDDQKELNRNWNRVAVSEINSAFSQGYIAQLKCGEFVMGFSMHDACPHCKRLIDGQVYAVVNPEIAKDYSSMDKDTNDYDRQVWLHDHCVWLGKDNYGRSGSKKKRIDTEGGNSADNLVDREHHELYVPTIPVHVLCRCRWIRINPNEQYVDKEGRMRMRIEDQEEWNKWRDQVYVPLLDGAHQNGVSFNG
jgi:hypothetical protein